MHPVKVNRLILFFLCSAITLLLTLPLQARIFPAIDAQHLQQAWRLASAIGRFHYQTNAIQTIHPTVNLRNAGRQAKSKQFQVEGAMDLPNQSMALQIRSFQAGQDRVTELKVENGQAYGRLNATADWTPIDQSTDLFAPGGDPLGFLAAAENVKEIERLGDLESKRVSTADQSPNLPISQSLNLPHSPTPSLPYSPSPNLLLEQTLPPAYLATLTRYRFDLNGVKYAEYMRAQMEEALRRKGELPNKANLAPIRAYVDMTGSGEIWVNGAGLPVRQVIQMRFPAEKGDSEWVEAAITTNFSDWQPTSTSALSLLWQDPARLIHEPLALAGITPAALQDFSLLLGLTLLMIGFASLLIYYRRSPRLYATLAASIIGSMLVIPLLEAQQLYAFSERQQLKADSQSAQKVAQDEIEATQDEQSGRNFDPSLNPLEENYELEIRNYELRRGPLGANYATRNTNHESRITNHGSLVSSH